MMPELDLRHHRAVAVVRTEDAATAEAITDAVVAGGLRVLEITSTVPDAPALVARLRERHGDEVLVGAGTVTTTEHVAAFADAGAAFLVAPSVDRAVIAVAADRRLPMVPGVFTPTEAASALASGATTIKLFPASSAGTGHLRALRSVLPRARFLPTGGVQVDDAVEWLAAGAHAVGIGSVLNRAFARGGRAAIEDLARTVLDRIEDHERTRREEAR